MCHINHYIKLVIISCYILCTSDFLVPYKEQNPVVHFLPFRRFLFKIAKHSEQVQRYNHVKHSQRLVCSPGSTPSTALTNKHRQVVIHLNQSEVIKPNAIKL